jgi:uncharacterized protein YciI
MKEAIMVVYPRHKALVDQFKAQGEVIGIGPFADRGNMGIFRTRAASAGICSGQVHGSGPKSSGGRRFFVAAS